jgi:hypothetical protein
VPDAQPKVEPSTSRLASSREIIQKSGDLHLGRSSIFCEDDPTAGQSCSHRPFVHTGLFFRETHEVHQEIVRSGIWSFAHIWLRLGLVQLVLSVVLGDSVAGSRATHRASIYMGILSSRGASLAQGAERGAGPRAPRRVRWRGAVRAWRPNGAASARVP